MDCPQLSTYAQPTRSDQRKVSPVYLLISDDRKVLDVIGEASTGSLLSSLRPLVSILALLLQHLAIQPSKMDIEIHPLLEAPLSTGNKPDINFDLKSRRRWHIVPVAAALVISLTLNLILVSLLVGLSSRPSSYGKRVS